MLATRCLQQSTELCTVSSEASDKTASMALLCHSYDPRLLDEQEQTNDEGGKQTEAFNNRKHSRAWSPGAEIELHQFFQKAACGIRLSPIFKPPNVSCPMFVVGLQSLDLPPVIWASGGHAALRRSAVLKCGFLCSSNFLMRPHP